MERAAGVVCAGARPACTPALPCTMPAFTSAAQRLRDSRVTRAFLVLVAIAGVVPISGWIHRDAGVAWWPLAARDWLLWGGLCAMAAAIAARADTGARWDAIARAMRRVVTVSPAVATTLFFVAGTVLSLAVSWLCFRGAPHSVDEIAQRWQATILLHGAAWVPADTRPDLFSVLNVVDLGGRWYSQFPPGGPLLLAIGVAVGIPALPNALATGATAALLHRWARGAGEGTARLAAALVALSPFVLFMGGSQQNHPPAMALAMAAIVLTSRWEQRAPSARTDLAHGLGLGLAVGILATIRPLDAVIVAVVVATIVVTRALRGTGGTTRVLRLGAGVVLGGLLPLALLLIFNTATTGHPLRFGYDVLWGQGHGLGFHESPYGELHTPARGLAFAARTLTRLDLYLLEWPLPPLLFLGALGALAPRLTRHDRIAALTLLVTLGAYAAYWHDGFFLGPRFAFIAVPATLYLVARGVATIAGIGQSATTPSPGWRFATVLVAGSLLLSVVVGGASFGARMRAAQYRGGLRALKIDPAAEARRAEIHDAVVVVPSSWSERLVARLWAAGVSRSAAERLVRHADACVAHEILGLAARAEPAVTGAALESALGEAFPPDGRVVPRPDLTGDATLRFSPLRPLSAACAEEVRYDAADAIPYAPFLIANDLDGTERVGGDVIFIRDMRDDLPTLARRFDGRRIYRYHIGPAGGAPSFEPLGARR